MKITILRSAIIDAPIDQVWSVLRDFSGMGRWHPAVVDSQVEDDYHGDVVGGVRRVSLQDGSALREQLLKHSDRDFCFTYCILDASLPLVDLLFTVQLKPVTDGNQTFWHWQAQFRTPEKRHEELEDLVGRKIIEDGFTGLRTFLADEKAPVQRPSVPKMPDVPAAVRERLPSKAIIVSSSGGPEVLSLSDTTVRPPGATEVRIRQAAMGVNYLDVMHRLGTAPGLTLPGTPGVEGAGKIIDVGTGVNGLFPGDRVAYISRKPGAYTQVRCVEAGSCISLPDAISDSAATTLLKGVTAGLLLGRIFRASPGESIFIQAAAGGLGHILSQWAAFLGMTVIGAVSSEEKGRFARDHGCAYPIVADDADRLAADIMRLTNGRGVDYWVESSGAGGLETAFACLTRCGHCALIGDREGRAVSLDANAMIKRSLTVSAPVVFDFMSDRLYFQRITHQFFDKIRNESIIPAIQALPLEQAPKAHSFIESRQSTGAVALTA